MFLAFRLAFNYISSLFLSYKAYSYYRRIKTDLLREGWSEVLPSNLLLKTSACMDLCVVEDVHPAPLNQLSPWLNTAAHVIVGVHVSQLSAPPCYLSLDSPFHIPPEV